MINTSNAYKEAIKKNREFSIHDVYTLSKSSVKIEMETGDFLAYSIDDLVTDDSNNIAIGTAAAKEYKATLDNSDGKFDDVDFREAKIKAGVGLKLPDGTVEIITKGTYTIDTAYFTELTVEITAYDDMIKFDKSYSESTLEFPAYCTDIVKEACKICGVPVETVQESVYWDILDSVRIKEKPEDVNLTFRDMLRYCAKIAFSYWRISEDGTLKLQSIINSFESLPYENNIINGGKFRNSPYAYRVEDDKDGGDFKDYSSGTSLNGSQHPGVIDAHIYNVLSKKINTDIIWITGFQIEYASNNKKQIRNLWFERNTVFENSSVIRVVIDCSVDATYANKIKDLAELCGIYHSTGYFARELSISCSSDPSIVAGDCITVTDGRQNSFYFFVTHANFSFGKAQLLESSCNGNIKSVRTIIESQG